MVYHFLDDNMQFKLRAGSSAIHQLPQLCARGPLCLRIRFCFFHQLMIMCVVKNVFVSPLSTLYRPNVTLTHNFHGAGVTPTSRCA